MADVVNSSGITTKTLSELLNELKLDFQDIYGSDINLDSNSPDGQLLNIFAQAGVDLRELITSVYNSFSPARCTGTQQDERYALNNLVRKPGSYTTQPIDIVVDRTVSLQGLDANYNDPNATGYTVQDDAGNEFILIDSVTLTAGSHTKNFRAKNIGTVLTTVGTITNQKTVVLGVTSVNNSVGALQIGEDQETDAEFRIRREQSSAINSSGYLNGLLAKILALNGVTEAKVYENVTNSTDSDGIPAHGVWLIVEGGANTDIANVLYACKSYGSSMKGNVSVEVIRPSGDIFTALFDRPTPRPLYIRGEIQPTEAGFVFDLPSIKSYIATNLSYEIGEYAETSKPTGIGKDALIANGGGGVIINVEVGVENSTGGVDYYDYIEVNAKDEKWVVDSSRITLTEVAST